MRVKIRIRRGTKYNERDPSKLYVDTFALLIQVGGIVKLLQTNIEAVQVLVKILEYLYLGLYGHPCDHPCLSW